MSVRADQLDQIAINLLVEARGLDGISDTIGPLMARSSEAWEGPAADRLNSELDLRRRELDALTDDLRRVAEAQRAEARRLRVEEAAAAGTAPVLAHLPQ